MNSNEAAKSSTEGATFLNSNVYEATVSITRCPDTDKLVGLVSTEQLGALCVRSVRMIGSEYTAGIFADRKDDGLYFTATTEDGNLPVVGRYDGDTGLGHIIIPNLDNRQVA